MLRYFVNKERQNHLFANMFNPLLALGSPCVVCSVFVSSVSVLYVRNISYHSLSLCSCLCLGPSLNELYRYLCSVFFF